MKKLFFVLMFIVCFCVITTAFADNVDIVKISMNDTVKRAKEIMSGNGIEFSLPDLNDNKFMIDSIELAVFERTADSSIWRIYKNNAGVESKKRLIENPASLNFQVDFGNTADLRENAKYKIGYRYHVKSLDDFSKTVIAGQDIKDGWRLVGENSPSVATDSGFTFYKNAVPTIQINSISYDTETINGIQSVTSTADQLAAVWLPADVLSEGLTVNYTASDYDTEDSLTIGYKLVDAIENSIVSEGFLSSANRITSDCNTEYAKLILTVFDNWGAVSEGTPVILRIDKEAPEVISQFNNLGKALRGRNLYSKFKINDGQNEALSSGNVHYTIRKGTTVLYNNVRLPDNANGEYTVDITGMADGVYEIELTMFDKAYNKTVHTLFQTLDNTAPIVRFLTPNENSDATLYSIWMNESKKIIFEVEDEYAGMTRYSAYLDNAFHRSVSYGAAALFRTLSFDVTTSKTGKLYYYMYVYDDARTVDKTNNSASTATSGNSRFISFYVWLDKTNPTVTINADETVWYGVPKTVTADFYDYPSLPGVVDNSGVTTKLYCVTENDTPSDDWLTYPSNGVTFSNGGVYYLHVKAIDYAGNETIETKKIKINTPLEIINSVTPTDDYWHTIYNHADSLYIIKNTAYNTKYHFMVRERDISDLVRTDVRLVSKDNPEIYGSTSVDTAENGTDLRDIVFNMAYTKEDGSPLPDGAYTMYLTVSEVKNDGTALINHQNVSACEIVIKRNSPPVPEILVSDVSGGKRVTISYPNETLANSLNSSYIKALYKREYKAVYDGETDTNRYLDYTAAISPITKPCIITAVYTDPAGNISTATKRIDVSDIPDTSSITVKQDGNTVTVEESRPATVYYVNTRRDKQSGINIGVFHFLY